MHTAVLEGQCEKCSLEIKVKIQKETPITPREDLVAISSLVNIHGRGITVIDENPWQTRSCPKTRGLKHTLKN